MDFLKKFLAFIFSDEARNAFVITGVLVALLSLKYTIVLAKKKQSSDLVFAGRNDKDFISGVRALKRRHEARDIKELAFARNQLEPDAESIRYLLNYFEVMSVGVMNGIYDERILGCNYRSTVVKVLEYSIAYIDELRRVQNNKDIYKALENLASRWSTMKF